MILDILQRRAMVKRCLSGESDKEIAVYLKNAIALIRYARHFNLPLPLPSDMHCYNSRWCCLDGKWLSSAVFDVDYWNLSEHFDRRYDESLQKICGELIIPNDEEEYDAYVDSYYEEGVGRLMAEAYEAGDFDEFLKATEDVPFREEKLLAMFSMFCVQDDISERDMGIGMEWVAYQFFLTFFEIRDLYDDSEERRSYGYNACSFIYPNAEDVYNSTDKVLQDRIDEVLGMIMKQDHSRLDVRYLFNKDFALFFVQRQDDGEYGEYSLMFLLNLLSGLFHLAEKKQSCLLDAA